MVGFGQIFSGWPCFSEFLIMFSVYEQRLLDLSVRLVPVDGPVVRTLLLFLLVLHLEFFILLFPSGHARYPCTNLREGVKI